MNLSLSKNARRPAHVVPALILTGALAAGFLVYWLLNFYIFPLCDTVFIWTREISASAGGLALAAFAVIAAWHPRHCTPRILIPAAALSVLLGGVLLLTGLYFASLPLLVTGVCVSTFGCGFISILVGIACMSQNLRTAALCVAVAYATAYVLRFCFIAMPVEIGVSCYVILPVIALCAVNSYAKPLLDNLSTEEPPARVAVSSPETFVPFGSQIFICLLLFRIIYGFALTFGESERVPLVSPLTIVPLLVLLLVLLRRRDSLNPDRLFPIAVLFVIAGFLAVPIGIERNNLVVNFLLSSGVGLFEILLLSTLIALGARNKAVSLVVFAWAYSLNSLGTMIGANLGRLANFYSGNDLVLLQTIGSIIVIIYVAYLLLVLKEFSFSRTIESMMPAKAIVAPGDTNTFLLQVAALSARFELSPREEEVLGLLARGRNCKFIQDELYISYNTAKSHVRHIYTKLNIHSQQHLIDLVEREQPKAAS